MGDDMDALLSLFDEAEGDGAFSLQDTITYSPSAVNAQGRLFPLGTDDGHPSKAGACGALPGKYAGDQCTVRFRDLPAAFVADYELIQNATGSYKGVHQGSSSRSFQAQIWVPQRKKLTHIGMFRDERVAALAYAIASELGENTDPSEAKACIDRKAREALGYGQ